MPVKGNVAWDRPLEWRALQAAWPLTHCFRVLGMAVSSSGSVQKDVREVRAQVLYAAAQNFSSVVRSALTTAARRRLLDRVCRSSVDFRAARWPVGPALGRSLDSLQRRCLALAVGCARREGEPMDHWQNRRRREFGALARQHGVWSARQLRLARAWKAHVERSAAYDSLLSRVWMFKNARWRENQRRIAGSCSILGGRMGTRVCTHVYERWEDSLCRRP